MDSKSAWIQRAGLRPAGKAGVAQAKAAHPLGAGPREALRPGCAGRSADGAPPPQSPSVPIPSPLRATPCGSVNPISSARWIAESSSTGSSGLWRGPSHILGHQPHTQSRTISPSLAQRAYDRTALSLATSTSCCLATAALSPLHKGREAPSTLGGSKRVNGRRGLLPPRALTGTGRLGAPDQGAGADTQGRGGKSPRVPAARSPHSSKEQERQRKPPGGKVASHPVARLPEGSRAGAEGREDSFSSPRLGSQPKPVPRPPHLPLPCPHSGNIL